MSGADEVSYFMYYMICSNNFIFLMKLVYPCVFGHYNNIILTKRGSGYHGIKKSDIGYYHCMQRVRLATSLIVGMMH